MQLELLTFRKIHPKDAREYKDALHESQDSVGVFKSSLIDEVGVGKRGIALRILAERLDETFPAENFVLMAGTRLVATGYAVKRENATWVEIGLWVRKQYEGQGVGTFMLKKLRDYALENLECDGVYLVHEVSNGAMAHMASKLGFEISEVNQRSGSDEIDEQLIAQDVISGFDMMRILHNPKANTGVLTKYGRKWADYQDRPLSQKIQIIPY
jgi:GNAT superfamily N-acetyltransferase